ncbi:hypothetical protein [Amycolatopsis sp. cmx-11-32]|uniref:hypothetical protein n=1 Tax=Amycolatopsis sp. cmx-11-32 TaxID=2785796 RepID=UPI0039E72773
MYILPGCNGQTRVYYPRFGPLTIGNSSSTKCGQAAFNVRGLPNSHVRGLRVSDCCFAGVANTENTLEHVDDLRFENTTINGKPV